MKFKILTADGDYEIEKKVNSFIKDKDVKDIKIENSGAYRSRVFILYENTIDLVKRSKKYIV